MKITNNGVIRPDGSFRQFGYAGGNEISELHTVTIDLMFRMATNGVIVNTHANDVPIITTSAGLFER